MWDIVAVQMPGKKVIHFLREEPFSIFVPGVLLLSCFYLFLVLSYSPPPLAPPPCPAAAQRPPCR